MSTVKNGFRIFHLKIGFSGTVHLEAVLRQRDTDLDIVKQKPFKDVLTVQTTPRQNDLKHTKTVTFNGDQIPDNKYPFRPELEESVTHFCFS